MAIVISKWDSIHWIARRVNGWNNKNVTSLSIDNNDDIILVDFW